MNRDGSGVLGLKAVALTPAVRAPGENEPRVFAHLRWRLLCNQGGTIARASRLRIGLIAAFSLLFWVGLFALFFEAFGFLSRTFVLEQIGYLFSAFFLSLFVMLVFSSGIIAYSGLYQSAEAAYLLTTPARADHVFAYKFQEVMLFSSWGFFLLGSPLMVAFSIRTMAPWYFYGVFLAYLVAFVYLPTSLGAMGCVLVAHWLPRHRKQFFWAICVVVGGLGILAAAQLLRGAGGDVLSQAWTASLLSRLQVFRSPLLPSWWMSTGLLSTAQGDWERALFYLLVILSNGLLLYLLASAAAARLYRPSYSRVQTGGGRRQRYRVGRLDRAFHRIFSWVPLPVRLLIWKDLRTFRRDPVQWSQFLIYFGLLGSYFFVYPRFGGWFPGYPRYAISFLNLSVAALILSTFTTRFVFPLLSLEGRKFWVLGLLPMPRESILWGKFAFAAGGALLPTAGLVCMSDLALQVQPALLAVHLLIVLLMCLGLAGISVGMGARIPNLREENPSKIAAGFGGTLNLVLSTVFLFVMLLLGALPAQLYFASLELDQSLAPPFAHLRPWLLLSMLGSAVTAVIATVVPLRVGARAFREMEF